MSDFTIQTGERVVTSIIDTASSTTVVDTDLSFSGDLALMLINVPSGINGATVQIDVLNSLGQIIYTWAAVAKGSLQRKWPEDEANAPTNVPETLPIGGRSGLPWKLRVTSASAESNTTSLGTVAMEILNLRE